MVKAAYYSAWRKGPPYSLLDAHKTTESAQLVFDWQLWYKQPIILQITAIAQYAMATTTVEVV